MGYRSFPEQVDEHIAYIYELLRRLRPNIFTTTVIQEVGGVGADGCPCPINIRICAPGSPDYPEDPMP